MDIQSWTKLIEVVVPLIQAIIRPLLVLFILIYLGTPIKKFMNNIGEFTFKAGPSGLEATAKKQQIEAAAALGAAVVNKQGGTKAVDGNTIQEIANAIDKAINPKSAKRLTEASVLWVDNKPSNNIYERQALEALGIRFTNSTSTEDALEKLQLSKYDAVISNMGRPPDNQAGYTLLEGVHKLRLNIPFIIYAGSNSPEYKAEAQRRGAIGSTNDPQELFQLVLSAIQNS